jgi:hypothetical protein
MQKIIKQDLSGSQEGAEKKAKYTWKKGETAWFLEDANIYKVKFTGRHWIRGDRYGREKVYEIEFLESSDPNFQKQNEISNKEEKVFYSTKKEVITLWRKQIINKKANAIETYYNEIEKLRRFQN